MKTDQHQVGKWCLVAVLAAIGVNLGLQKTLAAQAAPADAEEGVQVLTRGPVHEAFAETVSFDPQPGIVVPKAPPEAIEEVPPDQKPEGDNVAWIPGYWAWDDERADFLWVSGIWRALPPGRQWVPGYWSKVAQGYQWTSGYWADAAVAEVEYLPEPPETVETGPSAAATSADQTWVPGCWVWHQQPLRMAARLLAGGAAKLGLDSGALHLGPARVCLRRRLLGSRRRPPRPVVRAVYFHGNV